MKNFIQHVKKVAADDVRRFFEPFVAVHKFIMRELRRSAIRQHR
jgi:hypothetical protein